MNSVRIALVGEYSDAVIAHRAINQTFELLQLEGKQIIGEWLPTDSIDASNKLMGFDGIWIVPASPYASLQGALTAIEFARTQNVPFFGSCGGFQHAILEYCVNVLGWSDAVHAEIHNDGKGTQVISKLVCSLIEQAEELKLESDSILSQAYHSLAISESYHCSYGLNPEHKQALFAQGLQPVASNEAGETRAIELKGHPFFTATLFQPERSSLKGVISPIVSAFIHAAANSMN